MTASKYGEAVRIERERRGWTQSQLAERAGVTQGTISAIERGAGGMPKRSTIDAIARAMSERVAKNTLSDPIAVRLLELAVELDQRSATRSASQRSSPSRPSRSAGRSRKGTG